MTFEPPPDLVHLKRDFLIVEAGLSGRSGRYDFTVGMERLRELTALIQHHDWWGEIETPKKLDARIALIKATKAALPEGFPANLPEEMPSLPEPA